MEHTDHPLRKQTIIPLLFSLVIMLAASVASVFLIQRLHMVSTIKSNVNGVEQLFPTLLEMESSLLAAQIDALQKDMDLQKAWLAGDRQRPDWPGLEAIDAARDYPGRHGAIMLAWQAARELLPSG